MPPLDSDNFEILRRTLASTKALITSFEGLIQTDELRLMPLEPSSPNAVALSTDAAAILKAQTTKLSLLVLNKPFSPSEIAFILKSLCQECIPVLLSACQLCPRRSYTNFLHRLIRTSVDTTLIKFLQLLDEIPSDERMVVQFQAQKTLQSTGMIWESTDFITGLGSFGFVPVAVRKVEDYHSLLKDAIEELDEWQTGEVGSMDLLANQVHLAKLESDPFDMPSAASPIIQSTAKKVIEILKLIRLLYPALIKRRLKKFPNINAQTEQEAFPELEQIERFDHIMTYCQLFSEEADEIAGALYLHDKKQVDSKLGTIKDYARKCIMNIRDPWVGGEDEFTRWTVKWLAKLGEF